MSLVLSVRINRYALGGRYELRLIFDPYFLLAGEKYGECI